MNLIKQLRLKTKLLIEILWSIFGGLFFSMLPGLFQSGRPSTRPFDITDWFFDDLFDGYNLFYRNWKTQMDEFLFGFVVTFILIWSIKKYRKS